MRVLVISFFNSWITHLGTELELAQRHLDDGDTVEFLGCDGCIKVCDGNPWQYKPICTACRERRHNGINQLNPVPLQHTLSQYLTNDVLSQEDNDLRSIVDAASAKSFAYKGHDLGWGALSSTIKHIRDPHCETEEAIASLREFSESAYRSYHAVTTFLKQQPAFDRAYIFNGRFAATRGALRACQDFGHIDIQNHERGSSPAKYDMYGDALPTDRELRNQRIHDAWANAEDREEATRIGSQFYESRRSGGATTWMSFVGTQTAGTLPSNWDESKTNIAIFNSSEDEFAAIGDEWKNPVYDTQSAGIERIVADAKDRFPNTHFYLRIHPNLADVKNDDLMRVLTLESPNFTLIPPDSEVSTYALLGAVDRVLSFGTTVGIEATFWGKVSILAGRTFYDQLDAVHVARDHEHVMSLLDEKLEPCPKENAIKYGYYVGSRGLPFKYWEPDGFEAGTYRGFPINETHLPPRKLKLILWLQDKGLDTRRFSLLLKLADIPIRMLQVVGKLFSKPSVSVEPTPAEHN